MKKKQSDIDKIKDSAAKHWHKPRFCGLSHADEWAGGCQYSDGFYLHQSAYIAGYKAAQRDARRKRD